MAVSVATAFTKANSIGTYTTALEMGLSVAKAISGVIGSEYETMQSETSDEGNATRITYYIPTGSIGYPGWFIVIDSQDSSYNPNNFVQIGIYTEDESKTSPNFKDPNYISSQNYKSLSTSESDNWWSSNNPGTCVMISDSSKDTVIFEVHMGTNFHGGVQEGITEGIAKISFSFFLARDINENVVCGCGAGHIRSIRSIDSKMDFSDLTSNPQSGRISGTLHLTKMINYLSTDCPEMKSAYVSLVRPVEDALGGPYLSTTYVGGKRWWRAGRIDSYGSGSWNICYFPIEPFVNH